VRRARDDYCKGAAHLQLRYTTGPYHSFGG
jgi:hypothetical protein